MKNVSGIFLLLSLAASCLFAEEKLSQEKLAYFETHIRPALIKYCHECHSQESGKTKGGLLLDTREGMLQGGDNGNHDIFGKGMGLSVKPSREDSEITVAFDGAGIKRLLQSLAPLNKSE